MKIATFFLLLCGLCQAQILQRRTEPRFQEESCKDHLTRLRFGLSDISRQYSELNVEDSMFYRARSSAILESHALIPSFVTCTKQNLRELDVVLALWKFQYLTALMDSEIKGK